MSEQMKAAAQRFMQEVVSEGRLDVISELVAEDFVEHETMPGMPEGPRGRRLVRDRLPKRGPRPARRGR
jgi:hypothetical protein